MHYGFLSQLQYGLRLTGCIQRGNATCVLGYIYVENDGRIPLSIFRRLISYA